MGYSKLKANELVELDPIVKRLEALDEGESIILKDSPAAVDRLRYLVYSYLHNNGIKPFFKVIRRTVGSLEILRRTTLRPTILETPTVSQRVEEFVKTCMLEIGDERQAEMCVRQAVENSELLLSESVECLELWRKKVAPTKAPIQRDT